MAPVDFADGLKSGPQTVDSDRHNMCNIISNITNHIISLYIHTSIINSHH